MDMQHVVRRGVVLAAVQRAMFCGDSKCGRVLDIDSAVIVENRSTHASAVICRACWDKLAPTLSPAGVALLEVWDGKDGAEIA